MDVLRRLLVPWAGVAGAVGWSGRFECLPLAALVILCWRWSRSGREAFVVALVYYGAASFGLVDASARFFERASPVPGTGWFIWVLVSAMLATPWAVCWSPGFKASAGVRVVRGCLLGVVLLVPPVGLLSGANPWVAGVSVLPGLGLLGFPFLTVCFLAPSRRTWPFFGALLAVVSCLCCARSVTKVTPPFAGLSTNYGRLGGSSPDDVYARAHEAWRRAARSDAALVLFPEGLGGPWTASTKSLWSAVAEEQGRVLVVGAIQREHEAARNGVGVVGPGVLDFWPQRLPAPVGMWAPWRPDHVKSDLFGPGVKEMQGRKVALLLCFEQFVGWPLFQSALAGGELVLAPANLWFAQGTNLNDIREVTLQSWAALMGWQVVEAING